MANMTDAERIEALERAVADLQRESVFNRRLGPQPRTQDEVNAGVQKIVERLKQGVPHEHETDNAGRQICTTSGEAPSKVRAEQTEPSGMHKSYVVLCEEERQKGFVRPYRDRYKHVGGLALSTFQEDGSDVQACRLCKRTEAEIVNDPPSSCQHREGGCGCVTTMGRALSETYARDPKFYGATFCVQCNKHSPVSEFIWTADNQEVGS